MLAEWRVMEARAASARGQVSGTHARVPAVDSATTFFGATVEFHSRRSTCLARPRPARPHTSSGDEMPHYLLTGYLPKDFDPTKMTEAQVNEIHAINREMVAAGVRRFAGGLGAARTLRPQRNGEVLITDGPFLETKEQVGGLTIVETKDLDEAMAWARRGAKVSRAAVELREIFFNPAPEG